MTGPLAQQFARLEESLAFAHSEGLLPDQYEDALAALSVIERHVQDMEKALRTIEGAVDRYDICLHPEADPEDVLWFVRDQARAALPAREKEEE